MTTHSYTLIHSKTDGVPARPATPRPLLKQGTSTCVCREFVITTHKKSHSASLRPRARPVSETPRRFGPSTLKIVHRILPRLQLPVVSDCPPMRWP